MGLSCRPMSVCNVIIVINKLDSRDFVITRMITDRIGLHSILQLYYHYVMIVYDLRRQQ